MRGNTITLQMAAGRIAKAGDLWQYDYGQRLILTGIELPPAYEVHFSNSGTGTSKTSIGDGTGVDIPDEFLLTGDEIHVWVFLHDGDTDGETEYHGIIHVARRARPTDEEPTPVQQSEIDQAIAALNAGVGSVEQIAAGIPETINEALAAAKESGEFDGEPGAPGDPGADGFSPVITVTDITGGHRVTITDATGSRTVDIMDGDPGAPGDPGSPGADGVSPTVAVSSITDGHRVTITDKTGAHSFDIMDGADGDPGADGVSPSVSVDVITGGHEVTITDASGDHTFDVMDGAKGDPGTPGDPTELIDDTAGAGDTDKVWSADKTADECSELSSAISQKYEKPQTGIPASDLASGVIPSVPVQDVQIDGTSILNQGVANVPKASSSSFGVAKVDSSNGIKIMSNGRLAIENATSALIQLGSNGYKPIVPSNQHESTFYGLAKAAGADMASLSSVTVGQYPESQKIAIQKMLGIYEPPFELLNDITLAERTSIDLSADSNGTPYNLLSVFIELTYPQNVQAESSGYGRYIFYDSNNKYLNSETGRATTSTTAQFKDIHLERKSNLTIIKNTRAASIGSPGTWQSRKFGDAYGVGSSIIFGNVIRIAMNTSDFEPVGTNIKIYGQRAY